MSIIDDLKPSPHIGNLEPMKCNCKQKDEVKEAFDTVGIIVRAKINRLCNENKHSEAEKLEKALIAINNADYNH